MNYRFLYGNKYNKDDLENIDDEINEAQQYDYDVYECPDNRKLESRIFDIRGGDSFEDYCVDFFEMLDEEEYYD